MFRLLLCSVLSLGFALSGQAAAKKHSTAAEDWSKWTAPSVDDAMLTPEFFNHLTTRFGDSKRNVAGEYSENDFSKAPDMVEFRSAYLSVTTADQLETLLKAVNGNPGDMDANQKQWSGYSPSKQYFAANLVTLLPLRGIVWRMRPLFEKGMLFSGNKATHGMAVALVRQAAAGVYTFFPTDQWKAGFAFVTQPAQNMTLNDQFQTILDFQRYLKNELVPAMAQSAAHVNALLQPNMPTPAFIWDHKMVYGPGSFRDANHRYVKYGPAEVMTSNAMIYRAIHDAMVFTAYDQDQLLSVWGEIGKKFGIDAVTGAADMGMTDEQRTAIIMGNVKLGFLQIRDENKYGEGAMIAAYHALKYSTSFEQQAYQIMQGEGTTSFALNPYKYQSLAAPKLNGAVNNMVAAVNGPTTVHDPVSGDTVKIDLSQFYLHPYPNLSVLLATGWDHSLPAEVPAKNAKGQMIPYRNYLYGQSIAWNNANWSKIVPDAAGQSADYMKKAQRVIQFSLGTPLVAGEIGMFVR